MDIRSRSLGIWGYGIVGKSAAKYLHSLHAKIAIIDNRALSSAELEVALRYGTYHQAQSHDDIEMFIKSNDAILVSAGIDTRPFTQYAKKFIAELDLFYSLYHKPIIAITGSVGKTTITTLLSHIMNSIEPGWWTGGNIGTCTLEALEIQNKTNGVILEVSSFQLELCHTFAPVLAIITNIFPNHLDRHGTLDNYIAAKAQILTHQKQDQQALIPLEYKEILAHCAHANCHYFTTQNPTEAILASLPSTSSLFAIYNGSVKKYTNHSSTPIIDLNTVPQITFAANWLVICSALHLLGFKLDNLGSLVASCPLPAHRLELVDTINGVDFYNDSKGTTIAATRAAIDKLKAKPIILLLGGMGKGVERGPLIQDIKPHIKTIICFGKEHEDLAFKCRLHGVNYKETEHLETAITLAHQIAVHGDQIVLSPAGTSFDEFKNYEERGNFFKEQIKKIKSSSLGA